MKKWSESLWFRLVVSVILVLVITGIYFLSSQLLLTKPYTAQKTFIDQAIPLLPWTTTIYLTHAFLMMAAFLMARRPYQFSYLLQGHLILLGMSFIFFITVPLYIGRTPIPGNGFFEELLRLVRKADVYANNFPSLHVFIAIFSPCFFLANEKFRLSALFLLIWGIAISLTTMTTKQHYFIDVVTGVAIAAPLGVYLGRCAKFRRLYSEASRFQKRRK